MRVFLIVALLLLCSCAPAERRQAKAASLCKTDAELIADAEAALAAAKERERTGESAPVDERDAGKTAGQLAQEAAMSTDVPCNPGRPDPNAKEIPQIN